MLVSPLITRTNQVVLTNDDNHSVNQKEPTSKCEFFYFVVGHIPTA